MSIYGNSRPQFTDINGDPLQGGKLYIGMPDQDPVANPGTVTDLDDNVISATLTLSDVGVPTVAFKVVGDFSQAVFDINGVEVVDYQIKRTGGFLLESDLVGVTGQGGDFNLSKTYGKDDFVKGSNGRYYKSLTANNLGNDPVVTDTSWSRLAWPTLFNLNEVYDIDDTCIGSDGLTYLSTIDNNAGTDPVGDLSGDWIHNFVILDDSIVPAKLVFEGALVFNSVNVLIPSAMQTVVPFNSETYDTDDYHDNAVNNTRITIPAGVSRIRLNARIRFDPDSSGYRSLELMKNGTTFAGQPALQMEAVTGARENMTICSPILDVVATDYFEVFVLHTIGLPINILGGDDVLWFSMEVIQ